MIAFSASILIAKTRSVVPRPGWYAAWSGGMCCVRRSQVLSIKHIVKIFLKTDSRIIGRRFSGAHGPFAFPGFWSGRSSPVEYTASTRESKSQNHDETNGI